MKRDCCRFLDADSSADFSKRVIGSLSAGVAPPFPYERVNGWTARLLRMGTAFSRHGVA
jgi:hypothetical protein